MSTEFLDKTGLAYFWSKIKAWCNAAFAALGHVHASSDVTAMTGYSKPGSTSAIAVGDTLNQAIGKLEKAVDDADLSNVVHRTGSETVNGVKTFTATIFSTDDPSASNGRAAAFSYTWRPDAGMTGSLSSRVLLNGSYNTAQLSAVSYLDGNHIIISNSAFRIACETPAIAFYDIDMTKGTNPSATVQNGLLFGDSVSVANDHLYGRFDSLIFDSGETCSCIRAYDWTAGSTSSSYLGIHYPKGGTPYTYAPNPDLADNSNKIATTYFVKNQGYLTSHQSLSDYVTLSTEQTISGSKTFTMPIINKQSYNGNTGFYRSTHTLLDSTQTPSIDTHYVLSELQDKNALTVATMQTVKFASGSVGTLITARKHIIENGQTVQKFGQLAVYVDASGNPYTYAPTPATSDNSTKIATTAFVKSQGYLTSHQSLSNYVTINSVQTITGAKTFSAIITRSSDSTSNLDAFTIARSGISNATAPSTDTFTTMSKLEDSGSRVVSTLQSGVYANGTIGTYITAIKNISVNGTSTQFTNVLGVFTDKDGNGYTQAPTPETSDNSTKIATTAFVKNQNYVTLHTAQTISGTKTFTSNPQVTAASPVYRIKTTSFTRNTTSSSGVGNLPLIFLDNGDNRAAALYHIYATTKQSYFALLLYEGNTTSSSAYKQVGMTHDPTNGFYYFRAEHDNLFQLGSTTYRWKQLYAATSTINTSDERMKTSISAVPDDVLDSWGNVEFVQFRFTDAVGEKGDGARLHTGLVAQRIGRGFEAAGLDASGYGFFCYDAWDAEPEEYDEANDILRPGREAGDRYSLRYEEALCMEAAYMRRENARLKRRVADLEERLAALELKVS